MAAHLATFSFPTAIVFGQGACAELPARLKQIGARRSLVVTDKALAQTTGDFHRRMVELSGNATLAELLHAAETVPC